MTPRRIQRRRTKGWRMPPNTVSVSRPGKWGNRYRVWRDSTHWHAAIGLRGWLPAFATREEAQKEAVRLFAHWCRTTPEGMALLRDARRELRGKNVCDWCGLDEPCHGDFLLEEANR